MTAFELIAILVKGPPEAEVVLRDPDGRAISLKSAQLGLCWPSGTVEVPDPGRTVVILEAVK